MRLLWLVMVLTSIRGHLALRRLAPLLGRVPGRRAGAPLRSTRRPLETGAAGSVSEVGFTVDAPFEPSGDQPRAIDELVERLKGGSRFQVLRGATGTGKTFVIAHTVSRLRKPALVLCHNKTLAAQLARELKAYMPRAAVELFVSYYNYYRPEAYMVAADKYLSKISSINAELDAMRHRATKALFERRDVVIVASVSCIYSLGLPSSYLNARVSLESGMALDIDECVQMLKGNLYTEAGAPPEDPDTGLVSLEEGPLERGTYGLRPRVGGVDLFVWPPYEESPLRLTLVGDRLARIARVAAAPPDEARRLSQELQSGDGGAEESGVPQIFSTLSASHSEEEEVLQSTFLYPARHHVTSQQSLRAGCDSIEREMRGRLEELMAEGRQAEAARLRERTESDLVLLREMGTCNGVENYSRHFSGRAEGAPPETLLDYFGGDDWLLVADESHVSLPQLRAMFLADRHRKRVLVQHGFRLPSALDNRPLSAAEFWGKVGQGVFVSATPGKLELELSAPHSVGAAARFDGQKLLEGGGNVVEMLIRPTHVLDPPIAVAPREGQLERLLEELRAEVAEGRASLVVALTKRDAEDLSEWLGARGVRSDYLHSGLSTPERSEVLKALQEGAIDVIVGVNLLREGLDLPQVGLVAILDADKEGFLRNDRSLIQSVGRAARNARGRAIFFADRVTPSMRRCMDETERRRGLQMKYNEEHRAVPLSTASSVTKSVFDIAREEVGDLAREAEWSSPPAAARPRRRRSAAAAAKAPPVDVDELLPHAAALREMARELPQAPGVYLWRSGPGADAEVLYVGKAKNLRSRALSYLGAARDGGFRGRRMLRMLEKARHVAFERTPDEHGALLLESRRIKELQPTYNVLLRDDAFYPYICVDLSAEPPRLESVAQLVERSPQKRYFGPFTDAAELRGLLADLEAVFDLRRARFEVRYAGKDDGSYRRDVRDCLRTLEGRGDEVLERRAASLSAEQRAAFDALQAVLARRRELSHVGDAADAPPRDAAAVTLAAMPSATTMAVVQLLQFRAGELLQRFSYLEHVPPSPDGGVDEADVAEVLFRCLERHYLAAAPEQAPQLLLVPPGVRDEQRRSLAALLRRKRGDLEEEFSAGGGGKRPAVRPPRAKGAAAVAERKAMDLAAANAETEAERLAGASTRARRQMEQAAELLALPRAPRRIEAYDISHLGGEKTVASRVVFIDGRPAKHLYRSYNIRSVREGDVDDFASMKEVMERRFARTDAERFDDEHALPDLVLIDGGKGQLSSALKGVSAAGQSVAPAGEAPPIAGEDAPPSAPFLCSLAKREEEIFLPGESMPLEADADSDAVRLLRAVRDESHRFALRAHRRRRSRALVPDRRRAAGRGRAAQPADEDDEGERASN